MSRKRTRQERSVERTLRIGFRVKGSSHVEIERPELLGLTPALARGETIPLAPFVRT